jgi:hypothetical protein
MAEDLSFPIKEFVKDLFENPEIQPDFHDFWTGSPDSSSARRDPNGGYLFRFEFKFEEADDRLLFVATDRFGVGRESPPWKIYHKKPERDWQQIDRNYIVQSGSMSVHHPSRMIILASPPARDDPTETGSYAILKINRDGSLHKESYKSDQLPEKLKKIINSEAVHTIPEIKKIPLVAYLRSPQTKWRGTSEHGLAAQSLDPEDAPLLDSNYDVTWEEALALFHRLSNQKSSSLRPERKSRINSDASFPPIPETDTNSKSSQVSPIDQRGSKLSWLIISMVIVVIGLLLLIVKKRK